MSHSVISNEVAEFAAPWGLALKLISVGSAALVTAVAAIVFQLESVPPQVRAVAGLCPLLLLVPCCLFTIRGYTVHPDAVLVRRLLWSTSIPLTGFESAVVDPDAMRRALRVFGNGGLFSFSGVFWKRGVGNFRAYVTDLNRCVVLRMDGRTVVLSPDDPERFVRLVSRR